MNTERLEHGAARPLWMRMNAERYDADRVLLELGIKRPPVDVLHIADAIGARVHFTRGPAWDGAAESGVDGSADIYVDAGQPTTRQRFTIAHEIGHLLLHEPGRAYRDRFSSQDVDIAEIQANNFAANLLMPTWMLNAIASGRGVPQLADIFGVSPEAMRYRLQNLGYRTA